MSSERALTWSGKWHIVDVDRGSASYGGERSLIAACGAYLYPNDSPRYPDHLKRIKDGTKKSSGVCKLCTRSAGIKSVTVELPEPTTVEPAPSDDENGHREWVYPHGSVQVYDDGTIGWHGWHGFNPENLRAAAAALLAAAVIAEQVSS